MRHADDLNERSIALKLYSSLIQKKMAACLFYGDPLR